MEGWACALKSEHVENLQRLQLLLLLAQQKEVPAELSRRTHPPTSFDFPLVVYQCGYAGGVTESHQVMASNPCLPSVAAISRLMRGGVLASIRKGYVACIMPRHLVKHGDQSINQEFSPTNSFV